MLFWGMDWGLAMYLKRSDSGDVDTFIITQRQKIDILLWGIEDEKAVMVSSVKQEVNSCTNAVLLTADDKRNYIIHVYHLEEEEEED